MYEQIKLIDRLPEYYKGIPEIEQLLNTQDEELKLIKQEITNLFNNHYIISASEKNLEIWEKEINIKAKRNDDLEFRRSRLISRYITKPPFTINYIRALVKQILGEGAEVKRNEGATEIEVLSGLDNQLLLGDLMGTFEEILPLSMKYTTKIIENKNMLYKFGGRCVVSVYEM